MGVALRLAVAAAVAVCVVPAAALAAIPRAHASVRVTQPADVVAVAGELVNVATGSRMWSRDRNTELPIASITKVMTAMVVISEGDLNRRIRVTEAAEEYAQENSADSAGLHPGDVLTARQLLPAMLLPSGADAAYLLARAYGPGWRAFVRKMNAMAHRLGMTQTHFANFDGLPWPTAYSTYSTPRDLIMMGKAAMQNRVFRRIVAEPGRRIAGTARHHEYYWKNTNLLLDRYRGTIGIKTGFTLAAGYCLLFEARRHGKTLMGVVLDSTNTDTIMRFTAAANLLNWGFAR